MTAEQQAAQFTEDFKRFLSYQAIALDLIQVDRMTMEITTRGGGSSLRVLMLEPGERGLLEAVAP